MAKSVLIGLGGMGGEIVNEVCREMRKNGISFNNNEICCVAIDTHDASAYKLKKTGIGITTIVTAKGMSEKKYMEAYAEDNVKDWYPYEFSLAHNELHCSDPTTRAKSRLYFYDAIKSGALSKLEEKLEKLINNNKEKINVY